MRISDWSSDVCSSDLRKAHQRHLAAQLLERRLRIVAGPVVVAIIILVHHPLLTGSFRAPCLSLNPAPARVQGRRSEEHTSELQSLMRISYAVFCLKKKTKHK